MSSRPRILHLDRPRRSPLGTLVALCSLAVLPGLTTVSCRNSPAKTDTDRIADVHAIASMAEEFKQATGFYPLADVYVNVPVSVHLSERRLPVDYQYPPRGQSGSVLTVREFEEYLRRTLGDEFEIPKDNRRLDELPHFYIYRYNGENYFVAAVLDEATENTRTVADLYYKYEVGSKAVPERSIRRIDPVRGMPVAAEELAPAGDLAADSGPVPGDKESASPVSPTRRPLATRPASPALPDRLEILDLLRAQDFDQLEASLAELSAKAREDFRYEHALDIYLRTLGIGEPWMEPHIEAWVRSRPASAWAHLARARHFHGVGFRARGTKWAQKTERYQFREMGHHHDEAVVEARRALDLDADLLDPFVLMIEIARASGESQRCASLAHEALAIEPASYRVWHMYLLCNSRRWGGSQREMARLARDAQKHVERNPRLAVLLGYADKDLGDDFRSDKRYSEALEAYDRVLEAGEHHTFYEVRARALFWLDRYEEAYEDLTRALELFPQNAALLADRVRNLAYLGRFAEMRADLELAAKIEPTSATVTLRQDSKLYHRAAKAAYRLYKAKLSEEARRILLEIVEHEPEYAYAYFALGLTHKDRDPKRALLYFEQAIEKDPNDFRPYEYVHWLRGKEGEWSRVLEMWNDFLKLEPVHAEAYYKRSRANGKLSRREAEILDLNESCGFGYEKACERLGALSSKTESSPMPSVRNSPGDTSRYGPQPSARLAWERWLEIQERGIVDIELGIYTEGSKEILRGLSNPGHGQALIARLYKSARADVRTSGELAAVVFPENRDYTLAPWFFRRVEEGWQFDGGVLPELIGYNQNNQWHFNTADHPYTWAFEDYTIDENGYARPRR